ncbi:hypothetical protein L1887_18307 [Cichorium endivia]|nr:hypothetical protein L1887_18307 [Cichorium endivia]
MDGSFTNTTSGSNPSRSHEHHHHHFRRLRLQNPTPNSVVSSSSASVSRTPPPTTIDGRLSIWVFRCHSSETTEVPERTDEKKCRCSRNVALNQKYRERHINRGHHRSRKPVEGRSCHDVSSPAKVGSVVSSSSASVSRFVTFSYLHLISPLLQ